MYKGSQQYYHLKIYSNVGSTALVLIFYLMFYFIVITLNMRSTFLTNFSVCNMVLLTLDTVISRTFSLCLTELAFSVLVTPQFPLNPAPGNYHATL